MIIQSKEPKATASLTDLLGATPHKTDSKSNGLFSKLLASLGTGVKGEEKKGAVGSDADLFRTIIDPKSGSVKNSDTLATVRKELQALLNNAESKEDLSFISKELLDTLGNDQVRTLIYRAKEYLKNEIAAKAPEYQNDAKPFPKSLVGLIHLADKLGLEPQSITLSTFIADPEEQKTFPSELLSKPLLEAKALNQHSAAPTDESGGFERIVQLLNDIKSQEKHDKKDSKPLPNELSIAPAKGETHEVQPLKALLQGIDKRDVSTEALPVKEAKSETTPALQIKETKSEATPASQIKETKSEATPASQNTKTEGLIALLQGENDLSTDETAEKDNGDKMEIESSKTHQVPKADSFEVKTKEAQQSMRFFATDLKEAVENYKPPFTRLTMKLNPEQLGEVEVTLVQRGNNVHVNIQSNNATSVAFLAHNASELKAQLAHQGITNATMNFMGGGENQHSQGQQHQPQQHRFQTYQSLAELELNEEQLGALEIIIPHYA